MNLNRIFAVLYRMFGDRFLRFVIDLASRRGKSHENMTPEEREQARKARELGEKARKFSRLTRRF